MKVVSLHLLLLVLTMSDESICGDAENNKTERSLPAGSSRRASRVHARQTETSTSTCHLCEEDISEEPAKKFLGLMFHATCMNATRSHRRIVAKESGADELEECDERMHNEPENWREDVLPFIRQHGQQRDSTARTRTKRLYRQTAEVKKNMTHNDKLILTKPRYIAYRCFWDRIGSSEASEDFEAEQKHQKGAHNTKDTARVAVRDNARLSSATGTETKDIRREGPDESDGERSVAASGVQRGRRRSRVSPASRGHRENRRARPDRSRSRGKARERGHDDCEKGDRFPRLSSPLPSEKGRLTSSALEEHSSRHSATGSKNTSPVSKQARTSAASSGKISPLEFMKIKAAMKTEGCAALDFNKSPKSVRQKIDVLFNSMTPEQKRQLDTLDNTEITQAIDAALLRLSSHMDTIDALKVAWDTVEARIRWLLSIYSFFLLAVIVSFSVDVDEGGALRWQI